MLGVECYLKAPTSQFIIDTHMAILWFTFCCWIRGSPHGCHSKNRHACVQLAVLHIVLAVQTVCTVELLCGLSEDIMSLLRFLNSVISIRDAATPAAAGGGGHQQQMREMEDCKEAVTCAICLEVFSDARTLTCSHTFCLRCLFKYQTSELIQRECPSCRQNTVPKRSSLYCLPQNNFVNIIAQVIHCFEGPVVFSLYLCFICSLVGYETSRQHWLIWLYLKTFDRSGKCISTLAGQHTKST